jgi:hypothetical protein
MTIVRKFRETLNIFPDVAVRRVKKMSAVSMNLNPRGWMGFREGVASDVLSPVDYDHFATQFRGATFGDSRAEEASPYHENVGISEIHGALGE